MVTVRRLLQSHTHWARWTSLRFSPVSSGASRRTEAVPPTLDGPTHLYRQLTASRRLLVVLDDVAEPAHVKPLVPTGQGSVVVARATPTLRSCFTRAPSSSRRATEQRDV